MKPRLLDLCCCQGGSSRGYADAGFDVTGVDCAPQPRYPYPFIQADALTYLAEHHDEFDAFHASPPCQAHTNAQRIQGRDHVDLIAPLRNRLRKTGRPFVIENVVGAPLLAPVLLCGAMFGLRTYRHRLFESSVPIGVPAHPVHTEATVKMGRPLRRGDWYHAVGNFSNVPYVRDDMGAPWMNRDGLRESIPPAYARFIGAQLLARIEGRVAA